MIGFELAGSESWVREKGSIEGPNFLKFQLLEMLLARYGMSLVRV